MSNINLERADATRKLDKVNILREIIGDSVEPEKIKQYAQGKLSESSPAMEAIHMACEKVCRLCYVRAECCCKVNSTIRKELRSWYTNRAATRFKEKMTYLQTLPEETGPRTAQCTANSAQQTPY